MKLSYLSIGLISIASLSTVTVLPISHASAQCVINDTGIQVTINGSRKPTERHNNINQNSNGGCVGNTVNTTGVQVQTGGNKPVRQDRTVNTTVNGGNNSPTGVNLPPVKTRTGVRVDVYNPVDR